MKKKISTAILLTTIFATQSAACLCASQIKQAFQDIQKAVIDENLAKIPPAITTYTTEKTRQNQVIVQEVVAIEKLIQAEQKSAILNSELLTNIKNAYKQLKEKQ